MEEHQMDDHEGIEVSRPGGARFGIVSADVICDPSIPESGRLLYAVLATYAGGERTAFPSRARLCEVLGCSSTTLTRARQGLITAGVLEVVQRFADEGGQRSSLYVLHDGMVRARRGVSADGQGGVRERKGEVSAGGGRGVSADGPHNNTTKNNTTENMDDSAGAPSSGPRPAPTDPDAIDFGAFAGSPDPTDAALFDMTPAPVLAAVPEPKPKDDARILLEWWWERQEPKPAGKSAWHSGLASIRAVLEAGWSREQVGQALKVTPPPLSVGSLEYALRPRGDRKQAERQQRHAAWDAMAAGASPALSDTTHRKALES